MARYFRDKPGPQCPNWATHPDGARSRCESVRGHWGRGFVRRGDEVVAVECGR